VSLVARRAPGGWDLATGETEFAALPGDRELPTGELASRSWIHLQTTPASINMGQSI
jgi:hypothetical protein